MTATRGEQPGAAPASDDPGDARGTPPRVAVVGGGISGLAAAHRLRRLLGPRAHILLVEGSPRLGGAVRTVDLAGLPLDLGAEAFLVRRPEMLNLVEELGLGADIVHPTDAAPSVRAAGRVRPLPTRTVLGLPGDAAEVAGLLSAAGARRVAAEASLPLDWTPGQDAAVGALVRQRAGDELVDRLLDPLLGGVYAGRADELGLRATMPAVAGALDRGVGSLLAAAADALPPPTGQGEPRPPVFGTLRGGLTRVVEALVRAAAPRVSLGRPVRNLGRTEDGWRLELGSAAAPEHVEVDAVLLAVPAPALRRLLDGVSAQASGAAAHIDVASSAVVGLALPWADEAGAPRLPGSSGVLVATGEPLSVKAFTYSGHKWAHARSERVLLVRGSLGRHGQTRLLQRDDAALVDLVRADLAELTGITADPVASVVARWGGGLPQYAPGHLGTVDALQRAVARLPGIAVAGALVGGVGLPACVHTAETAARRLAEQLAAPRADRDGPGTGRSGTMGA